MATTEWKIKGKEYANCNCSYGCPCQFNALPTTGRCEAVGVWEVRDGHFGPTGLEGVRFATHRRERRGPVDEGREVDRVAELVVLDLEARSRVRLREEGVEALDRHTGAAIRAGDADGAVREDIARIQGRSRRARLVVRQARIECCGASVVHCGRAGSKRNIGWATPGAPLVSPTCDSNTGLATRYCPQWLESRFSTLKTSMCTVTACVLGSGMACRSEAMEVCDHGSRQELRRMIAPR